MKTLIIKRDLISEEVYEIIKIIVESKNIKPMVPKQQHREFLPYLNCLKVDASDLWIGSEDSIYEPFDNVKDFIKELLTVPEFNGKKEVPTIEEVPEAIEEKELPITVTITIS